MAKLVSNDALARAIPTLADEVEADLIKVTEADRAAVPSDSAGPFLMCVDENGKKYWEFTLYKPTQRIRYIKETETEQTVRVRVEEM